jgi:hypothetical protein
MPIEPAWISAAASGLTLLGVSFSAGMLYKKINGHLKDENRHHTLEELAEKFRGKDVCDERHGKHVEN